MKIRISAAFIAAILGLSITMPANAQLVGPNWPQPTSPYERAILDMQKKVQDAYEAGMLSDVELNMYDQEIFCVVDQCLWRRMRNCPDAINARRTLKRLKLVEAQLINSTSHTRR